MTALNHRLPQLMGQEDQAPPGSRELDTATALLSVATRPETVDKAIELIWAAVEQAVRETTTLRADMLLQQAEAQREKLEAVIQEKRLQLRRATAPHPTDLRRARAAANGLTGAARIDRMNRTLKGVPAKGPVQ